MVGLFLLTACAGGGPATPEGDGRAGPGTAAAQPAGEPPAGGGDGQADVPDGTLIVRTGTLELEIGDLAGALDQARSAVGTLGGYVASSREEGDDGERFATITYRIPVARWDEALADMRAIASRVVREATQSEDVTTQAVDLAARLQNARVSEAALQTIMERAGTIDDVLDVQSRLSAVREEIERLVAQQQDIEGRAALGTLEVTWALPTVALADAQRGWDLGAEVDRAAAQTVQAAQGLASLAVWLLIVGVPVVLPFVVIGALILRLLTRWSASRPPRAPDPHWGPGAPG